MPIGRANGLITAQDINLEAGLAADANMPFSTRASGYVYNAGSPAPNQAPNFIKMSGYGESSGFWGSTRASGHISNSYLYSTTALPTEMRLSYTTPFSISFFVKIMEDGFNKNHVPHSSRSLYYNRLLIRLVESSVKTESVVDGCTKFVGKLVC